MENIDNRDSMSCGVNIYELAINQAYEFIKSKGLEKEYKAQLNNIDKPIIDQIDDINNYTGL